MRSVAEQARLYGLSTAQADAALYDSNSHGYRRSDGLSIAGRKDVGDYIEFEEVPATETDKNDPDKQ